MGFSGYLIILYLILFAIAVFVFIKGKNSRKWVPFIITAAIMVIGIIILGCLWFASPM